MRSKMSRLMAQKSKGRAAPSRADKEFKIKDCTVPFVAPAECSGWQVVQVRPQQEGHAIDGLRRGGYHVWRPRLTTWITSARLRIKSKVNRALFPSYLFVAPDAPRCAILAVMEVSMIVGDVPARLVMDLARREGAGEFDSTAAPPPVPIIPQDTPVRILSGPFASFEGIISKSDAERCAVLIEILGRMTSVEVDAGMVEALPVAV